MNSSVKVKNNDLKLVTKCLSKMSGGSPPNSALLQATWSEELSALKDRQFRDLDEALDVLIERVLARMSEDQQADPLSEAKFLRDLLVTDPAVCNLLKRTLRFR